MRITIIAISVLLLYFCPIFAGNIEGFLKNGKFLKEGDVLLLNDTCVFKFNNSQQGVEYNWIVRIDQKDGGSYELKNQMSEHASFTFCIDSTLYRNTGLGKTFKRTILANDKCVYYTAQVYCYIENILQGVFPLKIDLLPSIPSFANVELIYDEFDEEYLTFKNDTIRFSINTPKASQLFLKRADHKRGDDYIFDGIYYYPNITSEKSNISIPGFEFEECYILEVSNDNGSVGSIDTAFVIDYIEDPNILEAIQEWLNTTDVCSLNNNIGIYYDKETSLLHIQNYPLTSLECKICDINGKMVKLGNNNSDAITLIDLPKGVYLATLYFKKLNKCIIYKFLK